jgi:hypothetical protein
MNQQAAMGMGMGQSGNMMESLKSNMMTMLMINNMNPNSNNGNKQGGDMFSMLYVFVATSVVDFIFKNAPFVFTFFMKKYTDKIETIKKDLSSTTKDLTDNKIKKKTASITVTINVNNPDNILGQSLLDFITNNKNTTHVSYIRENFILNQKDVINIDEEVFARMTQSTSADQGGQGATSTNMNSGAGNGIGQSSIVQVIEIYSFTKTTDELRNFLDDIKNKYSINVKNKLGNKRYYFNMHPLNIPMGIDKVKDLSRLPPFFAFIMKQFQTNRKFSNLFGEDIDIIRNRVNFFCKNRKWYDEKGIPYTLGLLLSGSPGTGKTSTIKCLANETNRHICNINLNNDMTKTQLENLFFNENINVLNPITGQTETYCIPLDQRIYVLEDVDCQSDIVMERALKNDKETMNNTNESVDKKVLEHYEDKHKVDLSFLLNLLDGVLENPGRIVIMTSNFPDMLDSALIRPGRIDVIAKFRNCSNKTVIEMIEFFYDIKLSSDNKDRIFKLKEEIVTPAELSKVMFENFSDFEISIVHMENLAIKKKEEELKLMEERKKQEEEELIKINENLNNLQTNMTHFATGVTLDMTQHPQGLIFNQGITPTGLSVTWSEDIASTTETINYPYNSGEKGVSEQKGEDNKLIMEKDKDTYDKIKKDKDKYEKIKGDVLYVFKKNILEQYLPKEKMKVKNDSYFKDLLNDKIFCTTEYMKLVSEIITQFPDIVENTDNLEKQFESDRIKKLNLRIPLQIYEQKIRGYFSPTFMISSGIKDQFVLDKLNDNLYNESNPFSELGSNLQYNSINPSKDSLNTSSYSAF